MKQPAVYILASKRNGTLYIGVTSNLVQRVWQHKEGLAEGFTRKYGVKMLVWYELHDTMESAIGREKAMKKWRREWKLKTIEQSNPHWHDLWPDIIGENSNPVSFNARTLQDTSPASVVPAQAGIPTHPVVPAQAGIQSKKEECGRHFDNSVVPADAGTQSNEEGSVCYFDNPVIPSHAGTQSK